jgi:hypothetical protein
VAIWQFNIYFIPRQTLLDKYGQVLTELEYEDALTIHWWHNLNLDTNKLLPLLQQFGDLQEWTSSTEELRSFGDTAANDISIYFDNKTDKVLELSCRLDLRQIDKNFIDKVFSIATQFDCLLMDSKGRLFQPSVTALADSIQLSNANRFVTDPRQFLDDLSKEIVKPEGI